jgi:ABC-type amino acid transport substrate-binding protein
MKKLLSLALLAALAAVTGSAQNAATQTSAQAKQFFPVEQVKPGMRAVGYTVFEGSEPRQFELEILGVLKGFPNPQQSAVL